MAKPKKRSEDWHPFYHPLTLHGFGFGVIVGAGLTLGRPAWAAGIVMFAGLCIVVLGFLAGRQWTKAQTKAAEEEPEGQDDGAAETTDETGAS